jgi:hypothetical protein
MYLIWRGLAHVVKSYAVDPVVLGILKAFTPKDSMAEARAHSARTVHEAGA